MGGIAGVEIAGYLFDKGLYMHVIYCSLAATVAHFCLFVLMHLYAEAYFKKLTERDQEKQWSETPKEVELKPLRLGDESLDNDTSEA